jgi:Lrp/AsnC family leucine-responsive transcriptional regulator
MDEIDFKIIKTLKRNGRSSASELSKQVNLSVPAVSERVKKIEQGGIIKKYTVQIDRNKTKHKLLAFILVNTDLSKNMDGFKSVILDYDNVLECPHTSGEYDFLLKVLAEDTQTLEEFLSSKLRKLTVYKSLIQRLYFLL